MGYLRQEMNHSFSRFLNRRLSKHRWKHKNWWSPSTGKSVFVSYMGSKGRGNMFWSVGIEQKPMRPRSITLRHSRQEDPKLLHNSKGMTPGWTSTKPDTVHWYCPSAHLCRPSVPDGAINPHEGASAVFHPILTHHARKLITGRTWETMVPSF